MVGGGVRCRRGEPCGRTDDDGLSREMGADRRCAGGRRDLDRGDAGDRVVADADLCRAHDGGDLLPGAGRRCGERREGSAGWRAGSVVHSCGPVAVVRRRRPPCRRAWRMRAPPLCWERRHERWRTADHVGAGAAAVCGGGDLRRRADAGCARDDLRWWRASGCASSRSRCSCVWRGRSTGVDGRAADGGAGDRFPPGAAGRAVRCDGERAVGA